MALFWEKRSIVYRKLKNLFEDIQRSGITATDALLLHEACIEEIRRVEIGPCSLENKKEKDRRTSHMQRGYLKGQTPEGPMTVLIKDQVKDKLNEVYSLIADSTDADEDDDDNADDEEEVEEDQYGRDGDLFGTMQAPLLREHLTKSLNHLKNTAFYKKGKAALKTGVANAWPFLLAPSENQSMYPMIIKGNKAHYEPWGHSDVEGLKSRLPLLQDGASLWIARVESETEGKTLALGDLKYLLSSILGKEALASALEKQDLNCIVGDPLTDHLPSYNYRTRIWASLRAAYPTRCTANSLKLDKLKPDENPTAFVEAAAAVWRCRLEQDPDANEMVQGLV